MHPWRFKNPISVAIPYYGGCAEDMQDTVDTVKMIEEALTNRGHLVKAEEVTKANWWKATNLSGDVVFNLVEDETWELYKKIGERIETLGKAQVGNDMKVFRYAVRKSTLKRKMKALGVATPEFRVFNKRTKTKNIRGLEYPLIVKPSGQHAGIGISQDSVVIDEKELADRVAYILKSFGGEVIAEEFVEGREIHVTVMGNEDKLMILPYSELEFKGEFESNWDIYTYDAKWTKESWEYWNVPVKSPISVSRLLKKRIDKLVTKAYLGLECRDIARFDIRVDKKEKPYIIDVNTSPSLKKDELDATWMSAKALGWSYDDLIETILGITYDRVYGKIIL